MTELITPNRKKLGKALRDKRGEMTLTEAAADFEIATGRRMDFTLLSRYENCKRMPNMDMLALLCTWMQLPPNEFYNLPHNMLDI